MSESSLPLPGSLPDATAQESRTGTFGNIVEILHDWVTTVDHKKIGILDILYSLLMLVAGGIEILLIRLQLAGPRLHVVPAEVFNRLFTMHGTTMIFFVAMPIFVGFANYLVPLMLGRGRYRFSTAQRFQLLDDRFRRLPSLLQFPGRHRVARRRYRAGCRLVCRRTAH